MMKLNTEQLQDFLNIFENEGSDASISFLKKITNNINELETYELYIALKELTKENLALFDKNIVDFAIQFDNTFFFTMKFIYERNDIDYTRLKSYIEKLVTKNPAQLNDIINNIIKMDSSEALEQACIKLVSLAKNSTEIKEIFENVLQNNFHLPFCNKLFTKLLTENEEYLSVYPEFCNSVKSNMFLEFQKKYMNQFSGEFGKIDYKGGLLALAAIHATKTEKPYKFDPVIFNQAEKPYEFLDFLNFINVNKSSLKNTEIKFALSNNHWIAGSILIDSHGDVKVQIIDSLGVLRYQGDNNINPFLLDAIKNVHQIFGSTVVTNIVADVRQVAYKGCSVYAIDDIQHLFSINDYLPDNQNIYEYLENRSEKYTGYLNPEKGNTIQKENPGNFIPVNVSKLPLYLMRTKQSAQISSDAFIETYQSWQFR